jgi:hypothetical protein
MGTKLVISEKVSVPSQAVRLLKPIQALLCRIDALHPSHALPCASCR